MLLDVCPFVHLSSRYRCGTATIPLVHWLGTLAIYHSCHSWALCINIIIVITVVIIVIIIIIAIIIITIINI